MLVIIIHHGKAIKLSTYLFVTVDEIYYSIPEHY